MRQSYFRVVVRDGFVRHDVRSLATDYLMATQISRLYPLIRLDSFKLESNWPWDKGRNLRLCYSKDFDAPTHGQRYGATATAEGS